MVAIAILGGFFVLQRDSSIGIIPLLGALAVASQRLLPALQQIYRGWTLLKGNSAAIQGVLEMLNLPMVPRVSTQPLQLNQSIVFADVCFKYNNNASEILNDINFEIKVGERVGIIGVTGSGKSTIVDILMGLLVPTSGSVLIDGLDLNDPRHPERVESWRSSIAHVPQSIFLSDSSIAENIAFGVPTDEIDWSRLRRAAYQAKLTDLIDLKPEEFNSFVGERGVRLSGGQRQRIGIARALYKNAQVLVLDEATSALDSFTESEVMDALQGLGGEITIIMIAHRITTLERCDQVLRVGDGFVNSVQPN